MKKITNILMLLLIIAATSCQKEKPITQAEEDGLTSAYSVAAKGVVLSDTALLHNVDKVIIDSISLLLPKDIDRLSLQKYNLIIKIRKAHPKWTGDSLYTKTDLDLLGKRGRLAVRGGCQADFNSTRNICNINFVIGTAFASGLGFATGLLTFGVGSAVGIGGVVKEVISYNLCVAGARQTYQDCITRESATQTVR